MTFSCAPKRKAIDQSFEIERFEFLQDGKTKRQEIIDRLGKTRWSYENDRILVYWTIDRGKWYHIVLIFDQNNKLEKHGLVRVR